MKRRRKRESHRRPIPRAGSSAPHPLSTAAPPPGSRFLSERVNRYISREADRRGLESEEEIQGFIRGIVGADIDDMLAGEELSPEDEAQELAFRSMETDDLDEAAELVLQALDKYPYCADAIVRMVELTAETTGDLVEGLQTAVAAAEVSLDPDVFENDRGYFWSIVETRPYMRARAALASALLGAGRTDEAIRHMEEMLELNPGDSQGIRFELLPTYLSKGDLEGTRSLLKQFEEEDFATMLWCRILERFLSGDREGAAANLEKAQKQNPHVWKLLTAAVELPKPSLEYYTPGQIDEAVYCAHHVRSAWMKHPEAVDWLRSAGE